LVTDPRKGRIDVFFVDICRVLIGFNNFNFYEKLAGISGIPAKEIETLDKELFHQLWPRTDTSKMLPYGFYNQLKIELARITLVNKRAHFLRDFTFSFFKEASASMLKLKPKVLDFVRCLRGLGCKIILTSNTYAVLYDAQRSLFPQVFSNTDGCILSHEIGYRKPDRAFWLIALDEVRWVLPERIFVVDDLKENIDSAKLLGMNGAVFTNIENLKKELEKFDFSFKK